ncbi:tripartite motif-containing protein 16-like [Colossoma macropomum]|uniref:tripartite motif-containing protein 16-like n=1 Tax=Colossoma macropomum TaxID=42526 RepID=UPI0018646954|nr:tripartite motif-containing protein 16-like [Colossoma macropomum]
MEELKKAVTGVMERVKPEIVKFSGVIDALMPKTREDFLKYSCQLTLDPNTLNRELALSERNRKITLMNQIQTHPDHPERSDVVPQVLCRESLTGRCYWEVEFSKRGVDIAVSYKGISRKSNECRFGCNDQSWSLICFGSSYSFKHNDKESKLSVNSSSSRIGVYVDHSAGILSFYSVSDTMTLLHRVHTTFTQPLYPGFGVFCGHYLQICDLE